MTEGKKGKMAVKKKAPAEGEGAEDEAAAPKSKKLNFKAQLMEQNGELGTD